MKALQLILSSLFVLLVKEGHSQRRIRLIPHIYAKTTAIKCHANNKYVSRITCKLKAVNREHTLAYADADIVGVIRNLSLRLEIFKYTNQYRPFLINTTVNLCELWGRGRSNGYIQVILKTFSKFSNLNHTCPYTGHAIARGLFMDLQLIPFPVLLGQYKFDFNFYEGWPFELVVFLSLEILVEEKYVLPNKYRPKPSGNKHANVS